MALNSTNVYLANSTYTYTYEWNEYCYWFADVFDITRKKSDIMIEILDQANDELYERTLYAVFQDHKSNNEDFCYFEIFKWVQWYSNDDYRNKWTKCWFGFVLNKVV